MIKRKLLLLLLLSLSIVVKAQLPPFAVYKPYIVPENNTKSSTVNPFRENLFDDIELRRYQNEIIEKKRFSTQALCLDDMNLYPVQLLLSVKRNGSYTFKCIGIKSNDRWISCDATVEDLEYLYERASNKEQILEYMEIANYLMKYNDEIYLIGAKN